MSDFMIEHTKCLDYMSDDSKNIINKFLDIYADDNYKCVEDEKNQLVIKAYIINYLFLYIFIGSVLMIVLMIK